MKRVLTAIIGIPPILAVIYFGPEWLFAAFLAIAAALALDEFLGLCLHRGLRGPGRWFMGLGAGLTGAFSLGADWVVGVLLAVPLAIATVTILGGKGAETLDRIAVGAAGLVYVAMPLGLLLALSRPGEVMLLVGMVWAGDTAAYYVGRGLGRHRLAPALSPKKTVEGSAGGLAASLLIAVTLGGYFAGLGPGFRVILGLVTGLAAQMGDLAESGLKRSAGVKDSSSLLPGHGGVLDRIDAFLLATPVYLLLLRL
jgi:phosphatidate cytidylyltransferase